jgi:hypothetical protein
MNDILYLMLVLTFFGASAALLVLCDRLVEPGP